MKFILGSSARTIKSLNLNPFSKPSLVGLDIQPHGMRLVQLKKSRCGFLLERTATAALPGNVFGEGKIKCWDILHSALAEFVQAQGIHGLAAAIHLPANLVRMQRIQLPSGLLDEDIEAEIYEHIQRDLPGMHDALCIDFAVLSQNKAGYSNIFFAATRQGYLSQYMECVNRAGLKVKIIDVDIYALKRAVCFSLSPPLSQIEVNAILHMVNNTVLFCIFDSEDILFHQEWDITEPAHLTDQLKTKIQFYLASNRHVEINKLTLSGDSENMSKMTSDIAHSGAFQLEYPDPFSRMKLSSPIVANTSDLLIACGLAMRECAKW